MLKEIIIIVLVYLSFKSALIVINYIKSNYSKNKTNMKQKNIVLQYIELFIGIISIISGVQGIFSFSLIKYFHDTGWIIILILNCLYCVLQYCIQQFRCREFYDTLLEYQQNNEIVKLHNMMNNYNSSIEVLKIKLGILKTIAPASLIPLIVGYMFNNNDIIINWNNYTICLIALLIVYFYQVWKCYNRISLLKLFITEIKNDLNIMQEETIHI